MALNAYLTLTGQKQGTIKGSATDKGHEDTILIHSYDHEIIAPRDPQSGLPTGKRLSQPVTILKEVDKSSPLLFIALTTNETLTSCKLEFFKSGVAGATGVEADTLIYTVMLTNASLVSIEQSMGSNIDDPSETVLHEEISLTYQKIEWTWNDGGITAGDDWETAV